MYVRGERETDRQTYKQTDRQTETERQIDRQTDRQTEKEREGGERECLCVVCVCGGGGLRGGRGVENGFSWVPQT